MIRSKIDKKLMSMAKQQNGGKIPKHVVYTRLTHARKRECFVFNNTADCVDFCYKLGNRPYKVLP